MPSAEELIKEVTENKVKVQLLEETCAEIKTNLHQINKKMDVIEHAVTQHGMVAKIVVWMVTGVVTGLGVVATWLGMKG